MYGQYTSASDYFTVGRTNVTTDNIKNAFTSTTVTGNNYPKIITEGGMLMMDMILVNSTIKVLTM